MVLKRRGIIILFAAFSTFAASLAVIFLVIVHDDYIDTRDLRLSDQTFLLSELIRESFSSSNYILQDIINQVEDIDITYPPKNYPAYQKRTESINKTRKIFPHAVFSGIITKEGLLSFSNSVDGFDFSDSDFFLLMKNEPDRSSLVSNAYKSPEGYYQVAHSMNLDQSGCSFSGLAYLTVSLDFFKDWISRLNYSDRGILTIIDENGVVLAQSTGGTSEAGGLYKSLSAIPNLSRKEGFHIYEVGRKAETESDYIAVRKIHELPFFIVVEEQSNKFMEMHIPISMTFLALLIVYFLEILILNSNMNQLRINSELKQAETRLIEAATTDSLTGLYNRRHFMELAEVELSKSVRHGRLLTALMIDLDHFKNINDTYGHAKGDSAIKFFSKICTDNLRTGDIAGRIGGEEFALILPETGLQEARMVAERIRLMLEELSSKKDDIPTITASLGICEAEPSTNLTQLLKNADDAMYLAKALGRNRVIVFNADKKPE